MSEEQKKAQMSRYRELARDNGDPWIWGIYLTLIVLSIVELYSASSREVARMGVYGPLVSHIKHLVLGALIVIGLSRVKYNNKTLMLVLIPLLWVFAFVTLLYVMFFGNVINNAARSFTLPFVGLQVQPAEFAKLSAVTALAYILARNQEEKDVSTKGVLLSVGLVTVFGAMMLTSSLTNTILLMVISATMLVVGGTSWKKLLYVGLVYAVVGGSFYLIKHTNDSRAENLERTKVVRVEQQQVSDDEGKEQGNRNVNRTGMRVGRLQQWFHYDDLINKPVNQYEENDKQSVFSIMAQAHGGLTGVGIGKSRECSRLPLAFSDYIFSIIVEETGLIGGVFVIILYLWLLSRAAMITHRCHRVLPALLIIGTASMVTYQALVHMAINTGVFPVSGEPLPLISKGGTSIIVTSIAFGIMLSVSRTIYNDTNKKSHDDELPKGLDAANPTEMPAKNEWK